MNVTAAMVLALVLILFTMVAMQRVSKARYRGLFESVPVALSVLDLSQARRWVAGRSVGDLAAHFVATQGASAEIARTIRVLDANGAALELLGLARREQLEAAIVAGVKNEDVLHAVVATVVSLQRGDASAVFALRFRRSARDELALRMSATPLPGCEQSWARVLISVTDTTQQQQLVAQVIQSQKMEAIGRLAGGIAHDFNNLLTVVSGFTTLAREVQDSPELRGIARAAGRASELTRHLLAFGRRAETEESVVDLRATLAESESIVSMLLGESIHLVYVVPPDLWRVSADPGQLQQVLMNLAVNARDAMPKSGWLRIDAQNVTLNGHDTLPAGDYVRLSVTDTGYGMAPEVAARVFEPFFTTKGVGKGSGIGLATAFGSVSRVGGHMEVQSEVGVGSTFVITLRRTKDQALPTEEDQPAPRGGSETILVVEDEETVLALTTRVLEEAGYTVVPAGLPSEALEFFENDAERIQLLLTDLIMPEMDGPALAEALGGCVPVLYMTGYSAEVSPVPMPEERILRKPFAPAKLLSRVRETLDAWP